MQRRKLVHRRTANSSIVDSESHLAFPTCRQPKDVVHLPTIHRSVPISFAHCRPSKQWIRTLLPSGAYLGLAPSVALSQTKTISLMPQLIEKHLVDVPIWSILLVNEKEGIFSIGGTSVASVRQVERESEDALTRIGRNQNHKRGYIINDPPSRTSDDQTNNWNWLKVQGAEGWWQTLMRGVWADGIKILESQPIVLDVSMLHRLETSQLTISSSTHRLSSHPHWPRGRSTHPSRVSHLLGAICPSACDF